MQNTLFDQVIERLERTFPYGESRKLYKFIIEAAEKPLIERILVKTEGNQLKAARILGINRNTLRAKIRKLGIKIK